MAAVAHSLRHTPALHRRRFHLAAQDGQPLEYLVDSLRVAVDMAMQRDGMAREPDGRDVEAHGPAIGRLRHETGQRRARWRGVPHRPRMVAG
jgi:hypothetical protein